MSRDFVEFINSGGREKSMCGKRATSSCPRRQPLWCGQSKDTPLEERFAAWEEIIETMPDSSFVGYGNFNFEKWKMEPAPVYGLHDFLRQYIQRQKELLAAFTREGGRHLHLGEAGRPLGGRRNQRLVLLRLPVRQL